MLRKLITPIYLRGGKAVVSLTDASVFGDGDAVRLAEDSSNRGADILMIFDQSDSDEEHEICLTLMRKMARLSDAQMWGAGNVKRVEDVKKILYAGCRKAVLNASKPSNLQMLEEVSKRFGREKIAVCVTQSDVKTLSAAQLLQIGQYAQDLIFLAGDLPQLEKDLKPVLELFAPPDAASPDTVSPDAAAPDTAVPEEEENKTDAAGVSSVTGRAQAEDAASSAKEGNGRTGIPSISAIISLASLSDPAQRKILKNCCIEGIGGTFTQGRDAGLMEIKAVLKKDGMETNLFKSAFSWDDLKTGADGLIPVVVQDNSNEEVLMVAYMNREAFEKTIQTGVMTYWSRSRHKLWVKGQTSGHYQYLKELRVDCDNDTLLSRVAQVGAACHTGNRSCFYRTALRKDTPLRNPMKVFEDVYATIEDRRINPKEGSYTNYLFEKGIDKILKKCGEEASEIIIAAKNPNPEEVKYEMADFLYHMMVLMSEQGITWEDIAQELVNRE